MSITNWTKQVRGRNRETGEPRVDPETGLPVDQLPISDPSKALLVRLVDMCARELGVMPPPTAPAWLYAEMERCGQAMSLKKFAAYFSAEASAGGRWIRRPDRISSTVRRLMWLMTLRLQTLPNDRARKEFLDVWEIAVRVEGLARTGKEVIQTGT